MLLLIILAQHVNSQVWVPFLDNNAIQNSQRNGEAPRLGPFDAGAMIITWKETYR
jgi:hypothetical protein